MKLEKFDKNKNKKRIIIGSIILVLLLIGGINLYRTFALYEEKKEFNVLRGRIPAFGTRIQYYLDDKPQENAPTKGAYGVKVSCDKEVAYSWDYEEWKLNLPEGIKTITCEVKFYTMPDNFSGYIMKLSFFDDSVIGETHPATGQTPQLTDYRYIGARPNNYVCLEENGNCKDEEGNTIDDKLYRIIGVIPTQSSENGEYENRVKLIKETSIGNYLWSGSSSNKKNNWATSSTNTTTLNQTYWNSIESYQKFIDPTKWYLGGYYNQDVNYRKTAAFYLGERGTTVVSGNPTYTIAYIGLLYPSDYGFATSGVNSNIDRNACLNYSIYIWYDNSSYTNCKNNDWLNSNSNYWTISHYTNASEWSWAVIDNGAVQQQLTYITNNHGIRPVFHLKSNVEYKSGNGSYNNPYRISIKE